MLTTCGSSSRCVRRRRPPNGVMRDVVLRRSSRRLVDVHARIVRNFRISNVAPFRPDARLAVEQRPPVRRAGSPSDARTASRARARRAPAEREHDVEQALHARVPRGVHLADVEQQATRVRARRSAACPATARRTARASGRARRPRGASTPAARRRRSLCAARLSTTHGRAAMLGRDRAAAGAAGRSSTPPRTGVSQPTTQRRSLRARARARPRATRPRRPPRRPAPGRARPRGRRVVA